MSDEEIFTISLTLTGKQIQKLQEAVVCLQDEGPVPEGWGSEVLHSVRLILREELEKHGIPEW